MTYVGIQYVNAQENIRHNRATELEAMRHNVVTENVSVAALGETYRHNVASENISQQDATTRKRAQDLAEREFKEVTKPRNAAQINLFNAQAQEARARSGLISAQTLTEASKQQLLEKQIDTQVKLSSKTEAETRLAQAKTAREEAEALVSQAKVGPSQKFGFVENNYLVQTVRSAFDTIGSLVHATVKYNN